jgi:exodeoxyribonuclease VII large subunit
MAHPTREVLSVTRLIRAVRALLEGHFGLVRVEGEISNLARPTSGHWYFSLKDAESQVRCAMFRARNAGLRFRPENGTQVLVSARVSMYEPRGEFQLIVEHMEPAGEGLLRLQMEALKLRLAEAGLFDPARKRPLPAFPRAIGVVTSPTGAAVRDILHVLARRNPAIPVLVYPASVQGAAAVPGLVAAIEAANRRAECDVLIVARGGGSLEDLWAFNCEPVVRAIFASALPVVSGVGHEIDFTLADLAADVRAPTPSAAAELCAPDGRVFLQRATQAGARLTRSLRAALARESLRLTNLARRLVHPGRRIEQHQQRLDELERRLPRAADLALQRQAQRLHAVATRLEGRDPRPRVTLLAHRVEGLARRLGFATKARLDRLTARVAVIDSRLGGVSPAATLARGYAIVSAADGRILRVAADVSPGSAVSARLACGTLDLKVEKVRE